MSKRKENSTRIRRMLRIFTDSEAWPQNDIGKTLPARLEPSITTKIHDGTKGFHIEKARPASPIQGEPNSCRVPAHAEISLFTNGLAASFYAIRFSFVSFVNSCYS